MKIVNVVNVFHPDAGYENNVLSKYYVADGHSYTILATDMPDAAGFFDFSDLAEKDARFTAETGVAVRRLPAKKQISGRALWNYRLFLKTIDELNPDVIFFCGNDTLIAMEYLLRNRRPKRCVVCDSHMLDIASKNRLNKLYYAFYKTFVTPVIVKNEIPVIRLQDDEYVSKRLGIPLSQAPFISFGSDLLLFHPDEAVRRAFREEHGIGEDELVFVYTGKMDEAKGGKLLAEAFREPLNGRRVTLLAVGKLDGAYGEEVAALFEKSENRILRFQTQPYRELAKFYQAADVSVFARQCSLSFYDAQGCGLPVVSEDNSVNVERNSHGNGLCFRSGDVADFRAKLAQVAEMAPAERRAMGEAALRFVTENYNYLTQARENEAILAEAYRRFQEKTAKREGKRCD